MTLGFNRPFPSSPGPLFQNEGRCSAFDMEIIFHSHANKTHFHKKGCAPSLILKVRVFGTRKLPIVVPFNKLRLAEDKGTFRHQHVETRETRATLTDTLSTAVICL